MKFYLVRQLLLNYRVRRSARRHLHAEFLAPQPGTYTYEINSSGHLISDSVTVSDVSVTVRGALNWQDWVTAGGLDPTDYVSLQDVLNDEEAVRRLFTVHAAVDYLTSFT